MNLKNVHCQMDKELWLLAQQNDLKWRDAIETGVKVLCEVEDVELRKIETEIKKNEAEITKIQSKIKLLQKKKKESEKKKEKKGVIKKW